MKALSILQPWADASVGGTKRLENRTRPTRYRGPILVHASNWPGYLAYMRAVEWISMHLPNERLPPIPDSRSAPYGLLVGGFIAKATIVGCVPVSYREVRDDPWAVGPWCWQLAEVEPIEFCRWKGRLGLFSAPEVLP